MTTTVSTAPVDRTPVESTTQAGTAAFPLLRSVRDLALDVAVPLGVYYAARLACDAGTVAALTVSSVVPALRTGWSLLRGRRANPVAALVLAVNVAGIALGFVSGDARLLVVKDSAVSSVIALTMLGSVLRGRPLMSAALRPWVTRGSVAREGAWDRLSRTSVSFHHYERRYTTIWGGVLLADCVARVCGAVLLPVSTLAWLSSVLVTGAVVAAVVVSGGAAVTPMERLVLAEAESAARPPVGGRPGARLA